MLGWQLMSCIVGISSVQYCVQYSRELAVQLPVWYSSMNWTPWHLTEDAVETQEVSWTGTHLVTHALLLLVTSLCNWGNMCYWIKRFFVSVNVLQCQDIIEIIVQHVVTCVKGCFAATFMLVCVKQWLVIRIVTYLICMQGFEVCVLS